MTNLANSRLLHLRPRPIQSFLFRAMHHSLCIGVFWRIIQNYRHRAACSICNAPIESVDHILTGTQKNCPNTEQTTTWDIIRRVWPSSLNSNEWKPSMGLILRSGCITPRNDLTRTNKTLQNTHNETRIPHLETTMRIRNKTLAESNQPETVLASAYKIGAFLQHDVSFTTSTLSSLVQLVQTQRYLCAHDKRS